MRNYELAFIISPNFDDEGATNVVEKVSDFVKAINGEVASIDVWGRRTLAYPIDDHREGTYVRLETKMAPALIEDLERNLKLSEDVIRYLLINLDS